MDITPLVEGLRRDLAFAVETGSDEVRAAGERLAHALEPAIRLAVMDALSEAASEITNEMDGTSVEVRLKGREPVFTVSRQTPAAVGPAHADAEVDEPEYDENEPVSRITLRLPESLKAKAEDLAARRGQSLNTWLVNAARMATSPNFNLNITSSGISLGMGPGAPGRNRSSKRMQGWVR